MNGKIGLVGGLLISWLKNVTRDGVFMSRVSKLSITMEVAGFLAVVASLAFVALEIRQNTNAIAVQAVFDLNQAGRASYLARANDADLRRIMALATEPDKMTEDEWLAFKLNTLATLNIYESAWIYHERGVISDAEYQAWQGSFCANQMTVGAKKVVAESGAHIARFLDDSVGNCE